MRELCNGTIDELRDAGVTFHDTEPLSAQKGDESTACRVLRSDLGAEDGDGYLRQVLRTVLERHKAVEIHGIVFHVLSGKWTAELSMTEYLEKRNTSFPGDTRYLLYDGGFLPYEGKGPGLFLYFALLPAPMALNAEGHCLKPSPCLFSRMEA